MKKCCGQNQNKEKINMSRKVVVTFWAIVLLAGVLISRLDTVKAQTSTPSLESEVSLGGGTGYGSTGIYARRFTSVNATIGSDITYTSSSVDGDSFTINTAGVYGISYTEGIPTSDNAGISVNLASTTSFSSAFGTANQLCAMTIANTASSCSVTVLLSAGDVIRAHSTAGSGPNTQGVSKFVIVKIR